MSTKLVITIAGKQEIPDAVNALKLPIIQLKNGIPNGPVNTKAPIIAVITGMGSENSNNATQWILETLAPETLLNIGTAGAMDTAITLGTLILPTKSSFSNTITPIYPSPKFLLERDDNRHEKQVTIFTKRDGEHKNIKPDTMSDTIIDREAGPQAIECSKTSTRFMCIKVITDYNNNKTNQDYSTQLNTYNNTLSGILGKLLQTDPIHFSVVIPTYNRAKQTITAIESVLQQNHPPVEIIVVDDGSTDNTIAELAPYASKITLLKHDQNKGVSAARNTGIKQASGNWIAFLDSDDTWNKEKLSIQAKFISKHLFYKIVHCNETWIRNKKIIRQKKHHRKANGWEWERCLKSCIIGPSCTVIHRSIFKKIGLFDDALPACEDYDLWCRISKHFPIGLVEKPLVSKFAGHDDQLSTQTPILDQYRIKSLQKQLVESTRKLNKREI